MAFQIFTDTSSGLTKDLREKYHIEYFMMRVSKNGVEYPGDIDYTEYSREEMYGWVEDPKVTTKTSLIPASEIIEKVEACLKKELDVLYIACAEALTGSRGVFEIAKTEFLEKYPDRKVLSVNSCRAEMALGLMVIEVAKMQEKGISIEDALKWVEDNREYFHEVGSIDTLKNLRAAGRVGGAAAFFADTFNIKPIIAFDVRGMNTSFKKVHGSKKALAECVDYIKKHMVKGVTDVVYIGEAMPNDANFEYLKKHIEEELSIPVERYAVSPIVGICCGPTMYGCFFKGDEVTLGK